MFFERVKFAFLDAKRSESLATGLLVILPEGYGFILALNYLLSSAENFLPA